MFCTANLTGLMVSQLVWASLRCQDRVRCSLVFQTRRMEDPCAVGKQVFFAHCSCSWFSAGVFCFSFKPNSREVT